MSNNNLLKPISIAISTAVVSIAASGTVIAADANPFGMSELSNGYMQLAEGKCGASKTTKKEGKCGEGKCGGSKKADHPKEGKCGEGKCGTDKHAKEGKCGEGKCGGDKKSSKEGKCGEGKCGGKK